MFSNLDYDLIESTEEAVSEPKHVTGTERTVDPSTLKCFPTPCYLLDLFFGGVSKHQRLGLAYGGWVTISGPSGHYKTILACEIIDTAKRWAAQNNDTNVIAQVLDLERTGFNVEYAESVSGGELPFGVENGVPAHFSAFWAYVVSFIKECKRLKSRGILVIDSVSTIMGDNEYTNTKTDGGTYGVEARRQFDLYSSKLQDMCAEAEVTLIFIGHIRQNFTGYGDPFYEKLPTKLIFFRNHGMIINKKIPIKNKNDDVIGNIVYVQSTKTRNNREKIKIPIVERTYYGVDPSASAIAWLARQKQYGGHDALMNLFANGGRYPLGVDVKSSLSKSDAQREYVGQEIWENLAQREISCPGDLELDEMTRALRAETIRVWFEKEERIAQENGISLKNVTPLTLDY